MNKKTIENLAKNMRDEYLQAKYKSKSKKYAAWDALPDKEPWLRTARMVYRSILKKNENRKGQLPKEWVYSVEPKLSYIDIGG